MATSSEATTTTTTRHQEDEEAAAHHEAVIFPWFTQAVGLVVFFLLSRTVPAVPYTAVLFVLGMIMGIGAIFDQTEDSLTESIRLWSGIDSEVLLLVFLPGLIFQDALNVNVHLFSIGLVQILLFAFPMVLAGTVLTASVAYYILPYNNDWSWNLCMTFGSILAATDPVAVAALLAQVGAPPRLTLHISGESMFNDGSAIVFYRIFSGLFLAELNLENGHDITIAEGFKMFFRLSLGGIAIGIAFGTGLLSILFVLDRRLNEDNNVLQVAATVTVAYLTFYVAEIVCETSGILAVVLCGITTRAFGGGFINNQQMMEDFWGILEHLLNSLLFTLGGLVFGTIIANSEQRDNFDSRDWGYLILLYVLVMAIRLVVIGAFYPILSRIGLGTNWQEAIFLWFGGLRGAVGIALAIALDNSVRTATDDEDKRSLTNKLFGMVGGVVLATLIINGTLAGPLLNRLGLTKSSETHKKILQHYDRLLRQTLLHEYAVLMNDSRFNICSFKVVQYHVEYLRDATDKQVDIAIHEAKQKKDHDMDVKSESQQLYQQHQQEMDEAPISFLDRPSLQKTDAFGEKELRLLFIELLRAAYEQAIEDGYLDARIDNGFVYFTLTQSLDFAVDVVNRGGPIDDWKYTHFSHIGGLKKFIDTISLATRFTRKGIQNRRQAPGDTRAYQSKRINVLRAFAFQEAHQFARSKFQSEFADAPESLTEAAADIIKESERQEQQAAQVLDSMDPDDLKTLVSHFVCVMLLSKAVEFIQKHHKSGLIGEIEAHTYLDKIDEHVHHTHTCVMSHSNNEATDEDE